MSPLDRELFAAMYAEGSPPWEIGKPQQPYVEVADQVTGSILEVGCGTGELALYFASLGNKVTGIDYLPVPIEQARQKALARNLKATFVQMDAMHVRDIPEVFDNIFDCGLFHTFSDADRPEYVRGLASALRAGGRLFLLCFSDAEPVVPGVQGPRRISENELRQSFAAGWTFESLRSTRLEIRPEVPVQSFSPGGPKGWFAIIRKL